MTQLSVQYEKSPLLVMMTVESISSLRTLSCKISSRDEAFALITPGTLVCWVDDLKNYSYTDTNSGHIVESNSRSLSSLAMQSLKALWSLTSDSRRCLRGFVSKQDMTLTDKFSTNSHKSFTDTELWTLSMQYTDFLILGIVGLAAMSLLAVVLRVVLVNLPITKGFPERVTAAYDGLTFSCWVCWVCWSTSCGSCRWVDFHSNGHDVFFCFSSAQLREKACHLGWLDHRYP